MLRVLASLAILLAALPAAADPLADQVRAAIAAYFGVPVESLSDDTRFAEDLGADDLDRVEAAMAIEEATGGFIPDPIDGMPTVGEALRLVAESLAEAN